MRRKPGRGPVPRLVRSGRGRLGHRAAEASTSGAVASLFRVPIYEYKCPQGHVFEIFQRIDDPQPEVCEICGEGPLQRVLHPIAVHFKGSGFYSTDYGRKGRKQESKDGDRPAKTDAGDKKDKKETKKAAES